MNKNSDLLEFDGEISEILPGQTYRVTLQENKLSIICYTGGKMRKNKIQLVTGDLVKVELSVYDLTKGRITYRI